MRWQLGCGNCPDLSLPPEIKNDSTAFNWKRKRDIYRQCQLHIATPSQWLMDKVKNSILTSGILSARVIPNGVDLTIFHPGEKQREFLKLPGDAKVLLFSADGIKKNPYKDFDLLMQAIEQVARSVPGIIFIALGEKGPNQRTGDAEIRFVPYQNDPELVANYYRAADIYIHAARAENFPTSIIEALACGTPVVATSIGGIPEQISDGRTGFLTKIGEPNEMASRIEQLLSNKTLMCTMKKAAAQDAREKFDVNKQVNAYLDWYQEILDDKNSLLTKIK
jgi:glycosyltransferase involved in cell wall biosynthesis